MAQGNGEEVAWLDDVVELIREFHAWAIRDGGGALGEHTALLYSSAARPFQSAFGESLYPTPIEKAAALMHGIVANHAFVDGNKRTGTLAALFVLGSSGVYFSIESPPSALQVTFLGDVALAIASGRLSVEQVAFWIERIFAPPA